MFRILVSVNQTFSLVITSWLFILFLLFYIMQMENHVKFVKMKREGKKKGKKTKKTKRSTSGVQLATLSDAADEHNGDAVRWEKRPARAAASSASPRDLGRRDRLSVGLFCCWRPRYRATNHHQRRHNVPLQLGMPQANSRNLSWISFNWVKLGGTFDQTKI